MALVLLVSTSRVSAEATADRLEALGIETELQGRPNVFVRVTSGGNYRVRVLVPEEELARAREELARWEAESAPRLRSLTREVGRSLVLAALPSVALAALLLTRDPVPKWTPYAFLGALIASLAGWVAWSRSRWRKQAASSAEPAALPPEGG
jgi:hypothetical protein